MAQAVVSAMVCLTLDITKRWTTALKPVLLHRDANPFGRGHRKRYVIYQGERMGLWLNIFCGEKTGDLLSSVDDFFGALDLADLEIEAGGTDSFDLQKTREALSVELAPPLAPPFHNTWCALVYGNEDGDCVGWDRYAKPEVDRHIEVALEQLLSSALAAALQNTLHNRLAASAELISTRLPNSSVNGIAFPLAREMAVWIATLRAGVVQFDETQWYVPEFEN